MLHPKISIITVTFNAESVIEKTLISILTQDYDNFELIVIDGFSVDKTLSIIEKYKSRIDRIISERDSGIYDAMNKGIKIALGDFVIFMNAGDSFVSKDTITKSIQLFNSKNSLYYGNAFYMNGNDQIVDKRGGAFNKYRLARTNICHQTIFYPKCLFNNTTFNTDYRLFADWDYNMRAYGKKITFSHINIDIAFYDVTGVSITQRDILFEENVKSIVLKNLGFFPLMYIGFRKLYKLIYN